MTDPRTTRSSAAATAARPTSGGRHPVHVLVAVGMTAGLYAASLAGVSGLQADSEARFAADRAPTAEALAALRDGHDALAGALDKLDARYATAAQRYKSVAGAIAAHELALQKLGKQVRTASGSASAMSVPSTGLPGVSSSTGYKAGKPKVNACTTASGKPC